VRTCQDVTQIFCQVEISVTAQFGINSSSLLFLRETDITSGRIRKIDESHSNNLFEAQALFHYQV
jgi:hypothetical protein